MRIPSLFCFFATVVLTLMTAAGALVSCAADDDDARTASTWSLLVPGSRFEDANQKRRSKLERIRQERAASESEAQQLHSKLKNEHIRADQAEVTLRASRAEVQKLQRDVAQLEADRNKSDEEVKRLNAKRAELKQQIQTLHDRETEARNLTASVEAMHKIVKEQAKLEHGAATQK